MTAVQFIQLTHTTYTFLAPPTHSSILLAMAVAYPPSPPASAQQPCSRVELHISCDDLRDADLFSKSDPIVSVHTQVQKRWVEVRGPLLLSYCIVYVHAPYVLSESLAKWGLITVGV